MEKFLGGKWRHGVGSRYVWSKYDHNNKTHKTTVQGAGGQFSYSGWTSAGSRAEASWEKLQVVIELGLMLNNNK